MHKFSRALFFSSVKNNRVSVHVSERVVLLSIDKTNVKEDTTLQHDTNKNKDIK